MRRTFLFLLALVLLPVASCGIDAPEEDTIWRYRDLAYDTCKEHGKPTIKPLTLLKKVCDRLAEFIADEWEDSWYSMSNFGKVDPMQMKLSAANDHFIGQFRTMIQLFMDWRNGVGRGASEKEIKRQWKNNFLSFLIRMNDGEMSVREHMIEFPYPASKANVIQGPNESPEEMQKKPKRPVVVQPGSREAEEIRKAHEEAEAAMKSQEKEKEEIGAAKAQV